MRGRDHTDRGARSRRSAGLAALERRTGLPAKHLLPVAVGSLGLALGAVGESADIAYHVDFGRDESLLTVPHALILAAVGMIVLAGLLALVIPGPVGPGAIRVLGRDLPAGGLVIVICSSAALAAFPLDGTWHELFGEDLTLWSPTHLLLIGGPTLSILGLLLLTREGAALGRRSRLTSVMQVVLAGFLLGALTDLQSEFGFGVPQFRLLFHPILVSVVGALSLVFARGLLGRGGALKALGVYLVVAGLSVAAGLLEPDRTLDRMPLYIVSAIVVELIAARDWRNPLVFGAVAGIGVGTLGLAAEWAWSQVWMPYPWTASLLPEAPLLAAVGATAAGIVGARMAAAFRAPEAPAPSPRIATAPVLAAAGAIVLVLAAPLPRDGIEARATIVPVAEQRGSTDLRVVLDPPDAASDSEWFRVMVIHGGSTSQIDFEPVGDGTYVTEDRVPVGSERDAVLRLARGTGMASVTVYSNGDEGHEEATALARRTEPFEPEHALPPVSGTRAQLQTLGYVVVGAIAALWLFALSRALARLEGAPLLPWARRRRRATPSPAG